MGLSYGRFRVGPGTRHTQKLGYHAGLYGTGKLNRGKLALGPVGEDLLRGVTLVRKKIWRENARPH
jgi:hypothetical protein